MPTSWPRLREPLCMVMVLKSYSWQLTQLCYLIELHCVILFYINMSNARSMYFKNLCKVFQPPFFSFEAHETDVKRERGIISVHQNIIMKLFLLLPQDILFHFNEIILKELWKVMLPLKTRKHSFFPRTHFLSEYS